MATNSSANLIAEAMADKANRDKQKAERHARLQAAEAKMRGDFRKVSDHIVQESHEETPPSVSEPIVPQKTVTKPDVPDDEYSDEELDGDAPSESDDNGQGGPAATTPDGFSYAYLPKFINNLQVWGGVGYFNYRIEPKQYNPRREELRALRKKKQATPDELEELDALNELLEKIEDAKQEIIKAGRMTKDEEKELGRALAKYLEVKKFSISPETTLALGFAAPMFRMAVAIESAKAEMGI